jgi:hypothetical protein
VFALHFHSLSFVANLFPAILTQAKGLERGCLPVTKASIEAAALNESVSHLPECERRGRKDVPKIFPPPLTPGTVLFTYFFPQSD